MFEKSESEICGSLTMRRGYILVGYGQGDQKYGQNDLRKV